MANSMGTTYTVLIDDNAHYMDESSQTKGGEFPTCAAAIEACKKIVEKSVDENYKSGITADELFDLYTRYGQDPFIVVAGLTESSGDASAVPPPSVSPCQFSARDYAKEYAGRKVGRNI